MKRWRVFLLALGTAAALTGQVVPGWYDNTARVLPIVCKDSDCMWTVEHLLTYYGIALDDDGLKRALDDRRADIRSMAADELAKKGAKEAIPWLADALGSESAVGTRLQLANALADLEDARGVAALEGLCKAGDQSDPTVEASVRLHAARSLKAFPDDRCKASPESRCNTCTVDLLRLLDRPGAPRGVDLRGGAMALAVTLKSATEDQAAAIRDVAERWIADEDEYARLQASIALALWGDAGSAQKLKAALESEKDATARGVMKAELYALEDRLAKKSGEVSPAP